MKEKKDEELFKTYEDSFKTLRNKAYEDGKKAYPDILYDLLKDGKPDEAQDILKEIDEVYGKDIDLKAVKNFLKNDWKSAYYSFMLNWEENLDGCLDTNTAVGEFNYSLDINLTSNKPDLVTLKDLDGEGTPELILHNSRKGYSYILTCIDGQLVFSGCLKVISYGKDTRYIIAEPYSGSAGAAAFKRELCSFNAKDGSISLDRVIYRNRDYSYVNIDGVEYTKDNESGNGGVSPAEMFDKTLNEIEDIGKNCAALRDAVVLGEKAQETAEKLHETEKELAFLSADSKKTDELREKLKQSDRIKEQLVAVRKSASIINENDGLKPVIESKKEELAKKIKEADAGERVMKKKQADYVKLTATVESLYTALSELITENVSSGKSDTFILRHVDQRFSDLDKTLAALRKKEEGLQADLDKAELDVVVYSKQCGTDAVVKAFEKLYDFNRDQMDQSSERLNAISEENGDDAALLIDRYHDAEKKKDELFRTYVLADNLLRETEAIDEKINENNVAVRSQQENLDALENAKLTLNGYLEKCNKKVEAADAEIFKLNTRKQYYTEIGALEYGNHCPVCNMPVIDKADTSVAMAELEDEIKKQEDEISSYRSVRAEYAAKLDEINVRIGSLRAKTDTGRGYVASLQQSKLAKIAVLKKLYASAGVETQDELIALLEQTVNEVSKASSIANELKGLTQSTFIAGENVSHIAALIQELNGFDGGEPIAQGRNKLLALEKQEKLALGTISGVGKQAEGDVYEELRKALERRDALQKSLTEVRENIIACQSRAATVIDGDKELNYGQLCIAYAGKQYISVIDSIREKEEEKKALINEISALNGILKDKRAEIESEEDDVRGLEARFNNNLDYLETLQNDGEYDLKLFKNGKISNLEEKILSDGEADEIRRQIEEFDKKELLLQSRMEALQKAIESADTDAALIEKKEALPRAEELLSEKKEALSWLLGEATIAKTLRNKRKALTEEAELYQENYSYLGRVYDDGAVILKDTVNHVLMKVLPRYVVECKGSGLVLKDGRREMTTINDEIYSVLLVALTDAFRYVVSGILDCPNMQRMVVLKASSVGDEIKKKLDDYARSHNIVILYVK